MPENDTSDRPSSVIDADVGKEVKHQELDHTQLQLQREAEGVDTSGDCSSAPKSLSDHARTKDHENDAVDAQHDSEAETEKLSDADGENDEDALGSSVKDEDSDADNGVEQRSTRASVERTIHGDSTSNGQRTRRTNGDRSVDTPPRSARRRKSSGAASNAMSWTSSAHSKHDSRRSPAETLHSPPPPTNDTNSPSLPPTRDRSNSITETRKRKARDDGRNRALEPPRQRHKTEGFNRESSNPRQQQQTSLANIAAASRQHRRSASTQSAIQGQISNPGRKRRDTSNLVINTHESRDWSSQSSSDEGSSPHRPSQPKLQHTRLQRSSHRSLTSPARTMPKRDTDKFGATKLARDAERGDLKSVIAAYNEKHEDLNRPDFAGFTPLQKAALNGYDDVVKFLLEKGCNTSCQSGDRDTPLIDASENGHIEVVRLLLRQGKVNPHHQNKKGQRAIDVLKDGSDYEEIGKELKEAMLREADTSANKEEDKANLPSKQASSLLYNEYNVETMKDKAAEGNVQLVGELLESRVKPNIACGIAAARGGHDLILSLFLAEGLKADPDPSKHSETYMTVAIGRGHLKVIELLLDQENFDPTRENREGQNYWQLAESRRGPKWEQERALLKDRYDAYLSRKSPNKSRKNVSASSNSSPQARMKAARRTSPRPIERSSSPVSSKHRRLHAEKSSTESTKNKNGSGKEMTNPRDMKRRRRVVDEESSEEDLNERRPVKKLASEQRAASEGEDQRRSKTSTRRISERQDKPTEAVDPDSENSDIEARPQAKKFARQRRSAEPSTSRKSRSIQRTPDASSEVESRRRSKGSMNSSSTRIKTERSDSPGIQGKTGKKSTSRDREKQSEPPEPRLASQTPSPIIKARLAEARAKEDEAQRQAEIDRQKKAEEARQKEEEDRKKEEEQRRQREAIRLREVAEQQRLAREAAATARAARLDKLPLTLRRACERGLDRPFYFDNDTNGIIPLWFPVYVFPSRDINPDLTDDDLWMVSFQCVGILGLPELDILECFPSWVTHAVTDSQRDLLAQRWDVAPLAQEQQYPVPGMSDFDCDEIERKISDTRAKVKTMSPLYWVKFSDFERELRHGGRDLDHGNPENDVKSEVVNGDFLPVQSLEARPNGFAHETDSIKRTPSELNFQDRARKTREQLRAHVFQPVKGIRIRDTTPHSVVVGSVNGVTDNYGLNGAPLKAKRSLRDMIRASALHD